MRGLRFAGFIVSARHALGGLRLGKKPAPILKGVLMQLKDECWLAYQDLIDGGGMHYEQRIFDKEEEAKKFIYKMKSEHERNFELERIALYSV